MINFLAALFALLAILSGPAAEPAAKPESASSNERLRLGDAQMVGQRIVTGYEGESPPPALRKRIRTGRIAGVILFADNFDSRAEARRLVSELQRIGRPRGLGDPLLVMIDQEGGLVRRLPGPPTLSATEMGAAGRATCRRQGAATGRMLNRTGINVDLAPVLDVGRAGGAIDDEGRSFSRRPAVVAACGSAFAAALERAGVAPTAKHFPGLGAARINTDAAVQRIDLSKRRLRAFDGAPYRDFIGSGSPTRLVMLSSAIYTAFSDRPAAFSRKLARGELRRRRGFDGVSITDALETASTAAFGGPTAAARAAASAGTDLTLFSSLAAAKRAAGALRELLRSDRRGFTESVGRVLALRKALG